MKEYLTRSNISYFSIGSGTPIIFLHGLSLDKQSTCLFLNHYQMLVSIREFIWICRGWETVIRFLQALAIMF